MKSNQENETPEKAELWMFPRVDEPNNLRWYELRLGFVFNVLKKEWEVEKTIYWRNTDDCIMVDLTDHVQRINRRLQRKKRLNETLATVRVTVHHKRELLQNIPNVLDWQQTCSSELKNRTSNTSFIVVQYFSNSAESNRRKRRAAITPSSSVNLHRSRAQRATEVQRPSKERGCTNYTYMVNLQKVFGNWVMAPTEEVDVGICYGFCDVGMNSAAFSLRGVLKNRLRNMENRESIELSDHFEVSCTPLTFEPVILLILMEETDTLVLMDYPIKVKSCGCQ